MIVDWQLEIMYAVRAVVAALLAYAGFVLCPGCGHGVLAEPVQGAEMNATPAQPPYFQNTDPIHRSTISKRTRNPEENPSESED